MFALVDDDDFERVNQKKWCASLESRGTKYYAIRREKIGDRYHKIRMHRFVLGLPPGLLDDSGLVVDHINHDPLDNRKSNLQLVTQAENMRLSEGWRKKPEDFCL